MRRNFDPPSEPPDGDPVCRICDNTMEHNSLTREWECTHDHDALRIRPQIRDLDEHASLKP